MPLYTIRKQQFLKADMGRVWDFMSSPLNLTKITPAKLGFEIISEPVDIERMHAGQIIEYRISPLWDIKLHWVTEITHVEPMRFFVDEQRFGPYRFWHHQHHFREVNGGVEMNDLVHYDLPFGPLGAVAHKIHVRKTLEEIFNYRYQKLEQLFNHASLKQ
ncbi:MAG: SRPBCC family protein [Bacteroidetes bacterium]|nr:SRPBCC family protein [Bacteroidota bacterium]